MLQLRLRGTRTFKTEGDTELGSLEKLDVEVNEEQEAAVVRVIGDHAPLLREIAVGGDYAGDLDIIWKRVEFVVVRADSQLRL